MHENGIRQIADALEKAATAYPAESPKGAAPAVFTFASFTVRCRPNAASIRSVAAKYRTGIRRGDRPRCPRREWAQLRVVGPYEWRT